MTPSGAEPVPDSVEVHPELDEPGLEALARELVSRWLADPIARRGPWVVGLRGDLGAGKTRFVQAAVAALPNGAGETVSSPTYALVHEHPTSPPVRHVDLYRLEDEAAVRELGPDVWDAPGWVFVEWVERAPAWTEMASVEIRISVDRHDARRVEVRHFGTTTRDQGSTAHR